MPRVRGDGVAAATSVPRPGRPVVTIQPGEQRTHELGPYLVVGEIGRGRSGIAHDHHRKAAGFAPDAGSASRRRAWRLDTLMPRRAATERGLSSFLSASKVARTRL